MSSPRGLWYKDGWDRQSERREDGAQKDIVGSLIWLASAAFTARLVPPLQRRVLHTYLFKDAVRRAARHRIGPDLLQSCFIDTVVEVVLGNCDHPICRFDFDKAG